MKKWFFTLLLILSVTAAFIWFALDDPGFIVIGRGTWTVETSLSTFIIALVLGGFSVYSVLRLLVNLLRLPWLLFQNRSVHQQEKAHESLVLGLLALIQGKWEKAEKILLKTISFGELSILHYLGAAYAAYEQKASSRVASYIEKARENLSFKKEAVAIALFDAKLEWQHENWSAALEKAQAAYSIAPKHNEVLLLLVKLYVQLMDWQALLKLLPEVRKYKVLPAEKIHDLEDRANIALIQESLRTNPLKANQIWSQIPKVTRLRPILLKVYVEHLMAAGDAMTAEPLVREALKYQWDDDLVTLYGALETANTSQQINYAESWLKYHNKDAVLLRTLGHLCLRNRLWGKARQYLEESVKLQPSVKTFQVLGDLLAQTGEIAEANEYYRRGLQLAL
jgi:HemY protein